MTTPEHPLPRAAAIVDDESCDVDALLAQLVQRQRQAGRRVRGLLMTRPESGEDGGDGDGRSGCAAPMVLVDLDTQAAYRVSQDLGPGATGCRADVQGFARASAVLRRALAEAPDLVVSNRFGGLEATGGGFRAELAALMAEDLPVLTVVATRHIDDWNRFTGGAALLRADTAAVEAWLAGQMSGGAAHDGGH